MFESLGAYPGRIIGQLVSYLRIFCKDGFSQKWTKAGLAKGWQMKVFDMSGHVEKLLNSMVWACWSHVSVITAASLSRTFHNAKK